jgi:hypothetical protein
MDAAKAGLTPRSPVIEVPAVVVIPVFDRITKLPAVPRFTGVGPAAMAADTVKATVSIALGKRVHRLKIPAECVVLVFTKPSL